ncbi:MAG TPA: GtrA family protein [Anaerolineales bacterium]
MTAILINPRERTRFLRFLVVGVFGAVVDFGIENLLHRVFGLPYVWSGAISFICAILSNFIWNRYWTYPDSRSKPIIGQLTQFAIVNVIGLVIRIPILRFLEPEVTKIFSRLPEHFLILPYDAMGENVTLAIAVGIVLFWNFFVNRYWTYSDVE